MEQNYVLQGACLYVRMPAELDHETGEEVKQTTDRIMAENHVKKIVFDFLPFPAVFSLPSGRKLPGPPA